MATRRALIPEADLRRWARISRQEGVCIHGRVDSNGGVTILVKPNSRTEIVEADDLDDRLAQFAGS